MIRYLIGCLLIVAAHPAAGQELTAEEFFGRPAPTVVPPSDVGGRDVRMPWIERYEFRTETRDFEPTRQEFTFRTLFSTPGLRRAQQRYYRQVGNQPNREYLEAVCEDTEDRYQAWLTLYRIDRRLALLDSLRPVLADQRTILLRLAQTLDFDWRELIDARTELTDLEVRQTDLTRHRERLLERFGFPGREPTFRTYDPATITGAAPPTLVTADQRELTAELELLNGELAIEEQEGKQYLRFAQFRYQGDDRDPFREKFAVSVGVQLPNDGARRIKLHELELERETIEQERALLQELSERANREWTGYATRELEVLQEQRRLYREEAEELRILSDNLQMSLEVDPLLLLRVRERGIRNRERLLDREVDLIEAYLDYLEDAGLLCERPDGTWLR